MFHSFFDHCLYSIPQGLDNTWVEKKEKDIHLSARLHFRLSLNLNPLEIATKPVMFNRFSDWSDHPATVLINWNGSYTIHEDAQHFRDNKWDCSRQ